MFFAGCSSCSSDEDNPQAPDAASDGCTAGSNACACRAGNTCDTGLVCKTGLCIGATKAGLTVSDPMARGCEVLLLEKDSTVASITFDATVKGTFVREAPKVAVSFVSAGDTAIGAGSIQLALAGASGAGSVSGVTVQTVSCVDAKAAALSGVHVTLNP